MGVKLGKGTLWWCEHIWRVESGTVIRWKTRKERQHNERRELT